MAIGEGHSHAFPRPADRAEFNELVYHIVRRIPAGRVMAYGDIARLIPTPASIDPLAYRRIRARWVGYALAKCPSDVPWQRVVNQGGRISERGGGSHHLQLALLNEERPPWKTDQQVDMTRASWHPTPDDLLPLPIKEDAT